MEKSDGIPKESGAKDGSSDAERLKQLRELLLGQEQLELEELRQRFAKLAGSLGQLGVELEDLIERLNDPVEMQPVLARALAEAVEMRDRIDREEETAVELSEALQPLVEHALHVSVERDPNTLAELIYPSVMPAIRRAMQHFFQDLVGQLSAAMDTRFSPRSLRWRLEAARTGVPFAEVVLMHTLEYRVEQLFLIHRETGLLLLHASADPELAKDADLVSGMLTAIQDFVRDSFHAESDDVLDTLQVGGLNVLVETSPHAILAAVVRGVPPAELRHKLQETLESLHRRHSDDLRAFSGDSSSLERSLPLLHNCLLSRRRDQSQPTSRSRRAWAVVGWTALASVIVALALWSIFSARHSREWTRYVDRLEAEPGIVVTRHARDRVYGLRDALASNPRIVLSEFNLNPDEVSHSWSPFISTDPEIVLRRVQTILRPPAHLSIDVTQGNLSATGRGAAWWIRNVRDQALTIPGVLGVNDPLEQPEVRLLTDRIQNETFTYESGQLAIADRDRTRFNQLVNRIDSLQSMTREMGLPVRVEVRGHASPDGPQLVNLQMSQLRAGEFRRLLVGALGSRLDDGYLDIVAVGMGAVDDRTAQETAGGRFVEFRISLDSGQN
jgi:OOP family OmpA-OmpF porin